MRKITFILYFIFMSVYAHADIQKSVTMGIYITSIHDVNMEQHYFGIEFLQWFVYRKEYKDKYNYDPLKTVALIDVYNNEYYETIIKTDSTLKNDIYVLKKVSAKIRNDFEVKDFPFDRQELKLRFQDTENDRRKLQFVVDNQVFSKSDIDSNIKINGIRIKSTFSLEHERYGYKNNFGNPRNYKPADDYDRVVATVNIEREVGFLFIKLFSGLYVSFFIAILCLLVNPKDTSTRFSLPVGALFAAVSNKYFVDDLLPKVNSMTLADMIHSITFLFIFFIIMMSVINIYIIRHTADAEGMKKIRKFDQQSFWATIMIYFILNGVLVIKASALI
ncbi:MAG: hypothetical protein NW207_02520 [Cytophagales bacterium]|nr:hypothetical protein [Cytophagales bacterium]